MHYGYMRSVARSQNTFVVLNGTVLLLLLILIYKVSRLTEICKRDVPVDKKPVVWIRGKKMESGYLKHVMHVFEVVGYVIGDENSTWDLLWSHEYPFIQLKKELQNLLPWQKVNHFPGGGHITNKLNLVTKSNFSFIPKAFRMPDQKREFLEYAQYNTHKLFVQKANTHRGIKIESVDQLDLSLKSSFVQEFIQQPLLIDGYKFDIGIYVILTSVDPLRVYAFMGDVLIRFCSQKYEPFNSNDVNKYVISDNYKPIWEIRSLNKYYSQLGHTMKDSLDAYLITEGKNPKILWENSFKIIREVFYSKEKEIIEATSKYFYHRASFFELMRFDFMLDANYDLYLMEVNMSPNLSTNHFPQNRLLYEQVLFNLFHLVGVAHFNSYHWKDVKDMQVSRKDIGVYPISCLTELCQNSCENKTCSFCQHCLNEDDIRMLQEAHREHTDKRMCVRVIPHPMEPNQNSKSWDKFSLKNRVLHEWFQGKCNSNFDFCS